MRSLARRMSRCAQANAMRFVQLLFDFIRPQDAPVARRRARGVVAPPSTERAARRAVANRRVANAHDLSQSALAFAPQANTCADVVTPTLMHATTPTLMHAMTPAEMRAHLRAPRGVDHTRPVQRRYDAIAAQMLAHYGLRVRRWRNSLSGLATLRIFRDGRTEKWVESPYPTSPLRMAIFLHEVGHHAIGLGIYKPRCLEEYLAWRFAIDRMNELGMPTDGTVAHRFERSMQYAVAKSVRRGIQRLPAEVLAFAATPLLNHVPHA